jgi:hypothetical protein
MWRLSLVNPRNGKTRAVAFGSKFAPECGPAGPGRVWCDLHAGRGRRLELRRLPDLEVIASHSDLRKRNPWLGRGDNLMVRGVQISTGALLVEQRNTRYLIDPKTLKGKRVKWPKVVGLKGNQQPYVREARTRELHLSLESTGSDYRLKITRAAAGEDGERATIHPSTALERQSFHQAQFVPTTMQSRNALVWGPEELMIIMHDKGGAKNTQLLFTAITPRGDIKWELRGSVGSLSLVHVSGDILVLVFDNRHNQNKPPDRAFGVHLPTGKIRWRRTL